MKFDLRAAHRHATSNREAIGASNVCGCFYCCLSYPAANVSRFLAEEHTALCPECTIDSVIGDVSGLPVADREFLVAMHDVWFAGIEIPELDSESSAPQSSGLNRSSEAAFDRLDRRFIP
ncbi:hypothetical protein [Caulobacter sp. SSI4214]|uniref:hypothetical protein n=1 Tax=Caulobacter sp. SSI4214 TaxID=2575739 RepID=UPI00158C9D69|nr:hypothetical protein [Caulobacter sp. SSI4214]